MMTNIAYSEVLHKEPMFGQVAWSPDGEAIAFIINRTLRIYRFGDGVNSEQMSVARNVWDFSWSPDGERIAVLVTSKNNELPSTIDYTLYIYDLADGSLHPLSSSTRGGALAWSPTSEWIAYASGGSIQLISPDGTQRSELIERAYLFGYSMAWSPDGHSLAYFDLPERFESVIRVLDITTLLRQDIPTDRIGEVHSWSEDGDWISYDMYDPDYTATNVYRINRYTSETQLLTTIKMIDVWQEV